VTPTAIVLAGERPGGDPLARSLGVPAKALIPIVGEAMVSRVVRTLAEYPGIGRIIVVAQDFGRLRSDPTCAWMADDARIVFAPSRDTIAATIAKLIADGAAPMLVTTVDNTLLTGAMIDHFLAAARVRDLGIAMVERRVLLHAYPQSKRSWLKFRGGAWSGANLFWIGSARVLPLIAIWRDVEQDRKKGWRVISAFGPVMLIGAMLRLVTLPAAIARIGQRHALDAALVPMPQPEACIDVDKAEDLTLAETILAAR
jgi:GTP:adenosylcobinamide-phosphate guanylyltransferase